MTVPSPSAGHHAAVLRRTARRSLTLGAPALALGAVAVGFEFWNGINGLTSWLVVGSGAGASALGAVLLAFALVCRVILWQDWMRQRSVQRNARRAKRKQERAAGRVSTNTPTERGEVVASAIAGDESSPPHTTAPEQASPLIF